MAQRVDDVIHLCCKIADQPEFEKTWKTIRNIKMITAAAGHSMLLFGPQELLVAGAVGGLIAWLVTRRKFKSLPQILMELPRAKKQKLYNNVVAVLRNLTWRNAAQLVAIVMSNGILRQRITAVLLNFIRQNL
ncbi:protein C19orf12 homolog [Acanthopagrus latus]|uniref:protein C19orf12 homolog n=1 Tax=Acanthopagrus latus TaxID=8177 RepID=UPI00187D0893|nr:protein C19orf12 homolog [Acanthopagrus latus]